MKYNEEYVLELENLVMDRLLPAYIEHCRRNGIDPNQHEIVKDLLRIMKKKKEVPILLKTKELKN